MPMPIGLSGTPSPANWKENNSTFGIVLDDLANAISTVEINKKSSLNVLSESSDADADALLELWNSATIVSEAESAEEKRYAVPNDFPGDKLMRLKAASLVHGDTRVFQFTSKAARVIKTVVLSESNAYAKNAVRKPYSVIMAEARARSATMSTLAFQKCAEIQLSAQRNVAIDSAYMPTRSTPWVDSVRLIYVNRGANVNKQYIVRMFKVNGRWAVIAWNGRNQPGRSLVMQPKGTFNSRRSADEACQNLIYAKMSSGYELDHREIEHSNLLGRPPEEVLQHSTNSAGDEEEVTVQVGSSFTILPPGFVPINKPKEPDAKNKPKESNEPVILYKSENDFGQLTDDDINFLLNDLAEGESLFD